MPSPKKLKARPTQSEKVSKQKNSITTKRKHTNSITTRKEKPVEKKKSESGERKRGVTKRTTKTKKKGVDGTNGC